MQGPDHAVHYLEIVTPDAEGVSQFYGTAYGWDFRAQVPELGHAFVAERADGSRCGIRAPMHEQEKPTVRTYLRVADVAAAAERAVDLGATLLLGPMEIPGQGTIAIYLIGGIEQGIWQVP